MNQPQKHIVYRSQAEQMQDEFWWSEGAFTPTNAGDMMIMFLLFGISIMTYVLVGDKYSHKSKRIGAAIVFIITTPTLCFLGYKFWQHF